MATPSIELITALRASADRIESGARFYWNHMGSCNCGHLAQSLTAHSKEAIHMMAQESPGDWSEHARDYCPDSGYPLDAVITTMVKAGMNTSDIANLERLGDPNVLAYVDESLKPLDFRNKQHAVHYIRAFADMLEHRWRETHANNGKATPRELVST